MTTYAHPLELEIERIERDAWADLAVLIPAPLAQGMGLQVGPLGSAFLFMASRVPQFQFNWLSGTGLNGDDGGSVVEAVKRFREAGQQKYFIQIPPGPREEECVAQARAAGLEPHPLAWAKFQRNTSDDAGSIMLESVAPVPSADLEVREVEADEGALFAETAVVGFGMPSAMSAWLARIVGRPHWHAYVTLIDGAPAGAAAMYVRGEFAWLGIGSTKPDMRKRGSQSALLARRIVDAAKLGAKYATTETGVPQAGQAAPSYSNILKSGFHVAYVRPNWARPDV